MNSTSKIRFEAGDSALPSPTSRTSVHIAITAGLNRDLDAAKGSDAKCAHFEWFIVSFEMALRKLARR